MTKVDVKCPFCQQTGPVKKHGQGSSCHQRYRCQTCCRRFELEYDDRLYPNCEKRVVFALFDAAVRQNSS